MSAFSARKMAKTIALAKAQAGQHADIKALLRASLEDLHRSECALEAQLGALRHYLDHSGLPPAKNLRAH